MIVFELICAKEHRFEGWFASAPAFEQQLGAGLVSCPVCSTERVKKLPAAKIKRGAGEHGPNEQSGAPHTPREPASRPPAAAVLAALVDHVLQNTEDVGRRFPEEARKIHNDLVPRRGIRGTATPDEAESLSQEGISVFSLPIPPRDDWH